MEFLTGLNPYIYALVIFLLRICDMSMDTIRVLFVVRGKKLFVFILGFLQAVIFVVAISSVLTKMSNLLNVLAYALGFATGNVVGMLIENRLAIGHTMVTIISSRLGSNIAERLRASGYAVTEISGRGKDGTVFELHASINRRDVDSVETIVLETDPQAFVTTEDIRPVRRGFFRA
jgi:uncharacterized protein YebE (UPF0316 family)